MRRGLQFKVKENKQQTQNQDKWEWKHGCQKCKDSFKKNITLHIGGNRLQLENCDDTSGISLEWTIARMFMPQGNKNNMGPEDTNPAALLYLMLNCDLFTNPIRESYKNVLTEARNKLHHSPDNKVEAGDKDNYFYHMEGILTDASNDVDVDENIRDAIVKDLEEVKKLKDSEISMTLYDDALKLKRKAIHDDFERILSKIENEEDMKQLKDFIDLAEKAGADLQALNDEMKNIGLYKKEMERIQEKLSDMDEKLELKLKDASDNVQRVLEKSKTVDLQRVIDHVIRLRGNLEKEREAHKEMERIQEELCNMDEKTELQLRSISDDVQIVSEKIERVDVQKVMDQVTRLQDTLKKERENHSFVCKSYRRIQVGVLSFFRSVINKVSKLKQDEINVIVVGSILVVFSHFNVKSDNDAIDIYLKIN